LKKEELKNIIEKLKYKKSAKESRFGFYQDPENITGYIKANKQGLELYAAQLLEAAITDDNHLAINTNLTDKSSEFFFDSVDIIKKSKLENEYYENQKRPLTDHLLGIGIIIALTLLIICSLIGIITVITWLF